METKLLNLYNTVNKSSYEEIAFKIFVDDLLRYKKTGTEKSNTITAMDMESQVPVKFIPSMFYTFMYASPNIDLANGKTFIDAVPLILCVSNTGETVSGVNFNMLPNNVRAVIIDIIRDAFSEFYNNLTGDYRINEKFAQYLISSPDSFVKLIKDTTGYNITSAFRQYNLKYAKNIRLIEYDQWDYIPFLVFKDAIRGSNLAAIQKAMLVDNRG